MQTSFFQRLMRFMLTASRLKLGLVKAISAIQTSFVKL